jgi:hypothetical protein
MARFLSSQANKMRSLIFTKRNLLMLVLGLTGLACFLIVIFMINGDLFFGTLSWFDFLSDYVVRARLMVEILVLIFWRESVSILRSKFRLGYKGTYALLRCRKLLGMMFTLDVFVVIAGLF